MNFQLALLLSLAITNKANEEDEDETFITDSTTDEIIQLDVVEELTMQTCDHHESTLVPDEKWLNSAIRDIAYYLRNYKFNEWDRRYLASKPAEENIGFYAIFPMPPTKSLHGSVYENCRESIYKCINYLHEVIKTCPMIREDDTNEMILNRKLLENDTITKKKNQECRRALLSSDNSGLPFDSVLERFQWRTTAIYYMCWYTMMQNPVLSSFDSSCDNYANCYNENYGANNLDPRASDKFPFSCAKYSFCPDPCCPMKHIRSYSECYENNLNPCFDENAAREPQFKVCRFDGKQNTNFDDLILNKLNVSCSCEEPGFVWSSEFGICIDVNECLNDQHNCNNITEDCLNLPGSYKCICRWGYDFNLITNKCQKNTLFSKKRKTKVERKYFGFMNTAKMFSKKIIQFLRECFGNKETDENFSDQQNL